MSTELTAKLGLFRNALWHGDTSGAVARVIVDDSSEALEAGRGFAAAVMTEIAERMARR